MKLLNIFNIIVITILFNFNVFVSNTQKHSINKNYRKFRLINNVNTNFNHNKKKYRLNIKKTSSIKELNIKGIDNSTFKEYKYLQYDDVVEELYRLAKIDNGNWLKIKTAQEEFNLMNPGGKCGNIHSKLTNDKSTDNKCFHYIAYLTNFSIKNNNKPSIYISGEVHGNERVGPTATIELIKLIIDIAKSDIKDNKDEINSKSNYNWIKHLLDTRLIIITPMTNPYGYYVNEREELLVYNEDQIIKTINNERKSYKDINRDFPYLVKPEECMQTIGARVVNEIFIKYSPVLSLSLHGGSESLTYPYGTPNHLKNSPKIKLNYTLSNNLSDIKNTSNNSNIVVNSNINLRSKELAEQYISGEFDNNFIGAANSNEYIKSIKKSSLKKRRLRNMLLFSKNNINKNFENESNLIIKDNSKFNKIETNQSFDNNNNTDEELSSSTNPPDNSAIERLALSISEYTSVLKSHKYPTGDMNSAVYPVRGGMEDWAYTASWEGKPIITQPCKPNTYNGYDSDRTLYSKFPYAVRNIMFLLEVSKNKNPDRKLLGYSNYDCLLNLTNNAFFNKVVKKRVIKKICLDKNVDGYISRIIRLSLSLIDLMLPYINYKHIFNKNINSIEISWNIGGSIDVDKTYIIYNIDQDNSKFNEYDKIVNSYLNNEYNYYSEEEFKKVFNYNSNSIKEQKGKGIWHLNKLTNKFNRKSDYYNKTKSNYTSKNMSLFRESIEVNNKKGIIYMIIVAVVDTNMKTTKNAEPNVPPQSHFVNLRTNNNYILKSEDNNQLFIKGKSFFISSLIIIDLNNIS